MTIEPKLRGLYAALLAGEKPWSWDWKYNPNLKEHMHALGVIAANYNELEGRFYGLFYLTFDRFEIGKIVFSKLNNAERMDIALRIAENEPESFRDRYIHFINAYGIRAFRRRKHDAVEDGKRHRQDHGIGGVALAVAAPDQCASIHFFDGGDHRTKSDLYCEVPTICREKCDERPVAADDASLRMMSANHPFVAKSQGTGPLRIRRVVAFGHPFDGTPQRKVFGTGEMASQEFADGQIICEVLQRLLELGLMRVLILSSCRSRLSVACPGSARPEAQPRAKGRA